jgi:signal transduction histidine kinase
MTGAESASARVVPAPLPPNEAARLDRLVTELLDLERLEVGKEELAMAPVSVIEIVDRSAALVAPSLTRHTVRLDLAPRRRAFSATPIG